ncbi:flavodoxin [Piscinibacter gummiphilus]|uniref:Flavodoxin n=1 Tax=Piscinibacter gummiphilus TaxID=946333 RepID=A0ABZ0D0A3_9BURK|nr:flavodoxin [Piscinibacter gummiphilus]WOB10638.1 flavodoxin [Piscinibacter gummiphilus]
MRKVLVVTYSNTGTSLQVAKRLCALQGWTLGEIEETRSRRGVLGTWRCVLDSLLRRHPTIDYFGPLPARFGMVVLVAPIWMYRLAGPMRSFVARYKAQLQNFAVISLMGSRGAPNAVAEIGEITGHSPVLSTAFTAREVEDGSYSLRLRAFAQAIAETTQQPDDTRQAEWSPRAA